MKLNQNKEEEIGSIKKKRRKKEKNLNLLTKKQLRNYEGKRRKDVRESMVV